MFFINPSRSDKHCIWLVLNRRLDKVSAELARSPGACVITCFEREVLCAAPVYGCTALVCRGAPAVYTVYTVVCTPRHVC